MHLRESDHEIENWRPGVTTRMTVSAAAGSQQLVIFEQWCDPGEGAPLHHHAVEEVLRVLDGTASISVAGDSATVHPGEAVIVPAGVEHGFTNTGASTLHTQAILAEPVFDASYRNGGESARRWLPGNHRET